MSMLTRFRFFLAVSILLGTSIGLSHAQNVASTATTEGYYPPRKGTWQRVTVTDAGADPELLSQAMNLAGKKNSKGVVILHKGKILAEQYWGGWTKDSVGPLNSATKSIASALVGMAIESGHIEGVEQSCSDFLSEWKRRPRYRRIQIQHLLSMTSGLKNSKGIMVAGFIVKDERAFATKLPIEYRPGTHWDYHNSAYHLLFPILEEATGIPLGRYTNEKLAQPLGMEHARWRRRITNKKQFNLMEMSTRDAARFGLLISRDGNWNGDQLVNSQWIANSTEPWDAAVNPAYGNLWWLNGGAHYFLPLSDEPQGGPLFDGVPDDAFAALGKDDQKIYVVPSLDLVVTRLGDAASETSYALSRFDSEFLGLICESLNSDSK
ncbi:MAG: serine hydrolase domain-containing protein [Mariniblastus sp.]